MSAARDHLYDSPNDFFQLKGSVWMRLTPTAAAQVCAEAAKNGSVVARVEGGIWHDPGFEARGDCIWDGIDPPVDSSKAEANNVQAANFIRSEAKRHSAFILTAPPLTGWPHKVDNAP